MIQLLFRLYIWLSIVCGIGAGLLADDLSFNQLVGAMTLWVFPPDIASSLVAEVFVWPAAAFAWLVPASTYAPEMFGAVFGLVAGGLFLIGCVGALIQISSSPLSIWLGMSGAFDDQ